uniref:uncharacterized protein LOC101300778 isoform X2 n=1 Tax=Fragaria vesca subsp. vesca TaxID=101020 RepID=UPI0005C977BA|nr:PREDICTED: uncharacterized protein LOC101300778 isoform X2 [Fragaria vesca subsp. vesca]
MHTKLREAWPIVKSLLEELGHSCSMDRVDSTVIMESPGSTDPHNIRKAKFLFELLCKTPVPAPLAIEMALHGRQHDVINLGTQNGGMCKKYGINKEEFDKFWRGLKSCLKELEDLTHCTLFLNKGTLIAVGPSPRVRWVRNVWKFSITGKLSPAHVIRVLNLKLKRTTMMGNSDRMRIERSDFGVLEQPKSDHLVSDPFLMREKSNFSVLEQPESNHEVNDPLPAENSKCFHAISAENRAKLNEAWLMVESSLEELGYLCAKSTVNSTVLVVSPCPTDPDILCKAKFLFKLLCKTPVPAPLAIDLALHGRQHDLIKLGKEYRITKEKFHKLRRCLKRSLKELEDLTHCTLFLNKKTLIAVGPSPRLHWVRKVWRFSITGKLSPAHVIRIFNRQLNRTTTTMMGNSNSMMMEKSDFCILEQPKFNSKVTNPFPMENSNTNMIEKSDFCVLEEPKVDHVVSDPVPMMENSDFSILEQPKSNHEVSDPLPMENNMCFLLSSKNRAKLKEAWPMVESSLEQLGYLCAMSMVDSTISLVLPSSTDPDITRKADYLFKLLLKTPVPAPLAIELALHGRQHDCIKLGPKRGLRKKYGMDMEKFDKLRRGLKRSLKELEDLTHCTLFLNKNTLTAVGPSSRLGWVRRVLKACIRRKLSPHHVISAFICKFDQKIANARDLDVSNVENIGHLVNEDGAAEVTLSFLEVEATRMEGILSMVESSLEKYGISCTLNLINCTVTLSTTEATKEYPDAFEKARHLLQLLTTSNVPPSLAFDLALNGKQHEFIKMGFQEGGLCSMYGIKKEQYLKRLKWLTRSLKVIRKLTACGNIYFSALGDTITCVGPSLAGLRTFRKVVLACIVEDLDPAYLIRKESKRKLKESINCLLA